MFFPIIAHHKDKPPGEKIIKIFITTAKRVKLFFCRNPIKRAITLQKDSFLHVLSN